ncbi:MAG: hypothetical protein Q7U02_13690 [Desulfosalsimonadaceae bacterium]|nr:hypothetical protein [Desulfosalsimonadaceae bacterium]
MRNRHTSNMSNGLRLPHGLKIINFGLTILIFVAVWGAAPVRAELAALTSSEMKAATGSGGVDFSIVGNTARIYLDTHIETYAEIDSIKLGYYERHNFRTMKFLDLEDSKVEFIADSNGNNTKFNYWPYINASNGNVPWKPFGPGGPTMGNVAPTPGISYGDGAFMTGFPAPLVLDRGTSLGAFNSYVYTEPGTTTNHYIGYTADSNYMTTYNGTADGKYVEGLQGANNYRGLLYTASLFAPPTIDYFSNYPSANNNVYDWDINMENVRFGTDSTHPMVIDGLVIRLKYDDITSPGKKLTDIIIGSNSMEGDFYADIYRATGFLSPKLPAHARNDMLESMGNFTQVFNYAPVPICLIRDSFLYLIDDYRFEYFDPEPGLDETIYNPAPYNPTNNNTHTGAFLRIGLDPNSPTFGFSMIMGYNEIIADAYRPDQFIEQSLRNQTWWDLSP